MPETPSDLTNWAGNVTFGAARVHRPESVDEIRRIVADAERAHVVGSGHSFSRVADTTGDLLRLDRLPRSIEIDREAMTATVDGGATYIDVGPALHRAGFALANLPSLPQLTVIGACATGTHGSGRTPSLSAAVTALELVTGTGDLVRLQRGDEGFAGSVVALGALGVVTRLTLEIVPTFEVAQTVVVDVPLDEVGRDPDAVLNAAYSVSVFTDWGDQGAVWLKRRTDTDPAGPVPTFGGRAATGAQHTVPTARPDGVTRQLGEPGPWHERLPHFRADGMPATGAELQSDVYLPRAAAPAAIAALREISPTIRPALQIGEMRSLAGDDLWLSPAHGRDTVSFHFTWWPDARVVLPAVRAVEERLASLGARPHWGKVTTRTAAQILDGYERAGDFAALAARLDPTGTFRNPTLDDLFPR